MDDDNDSVNNYKDIDNSSYKLERKQEYGLWEGSLSSRLNSQTLKMVFFVVKELLNRVAWYEAVRWKGTKMK